MVEMIRRGAVPPSLMRVAARGALSVPPSEMVEILVLLTANPALASEAEQTLAQFDEGALAAVCADPKTPSSVLSSLLPKLKPGRALRVLCDNPALPEAELQRFAETAMPSTLEAMLSSTRVQNSRALLERIAANPASSKVTERIGELLAQSSDEDDQSYYSYCALHAEEIQQDEGRRFELVLGAVGEEDQIRELYEEIESGKTPQVSPEQPEEEDEQRSVLQKIAKMRVGERVKLAMRGSREERMILIRDRVRVVSHAVLDSPKVNEAEMEAFAAMKNVQEGVLRAIASKRNYMKNYNVVRSLVSNPRTPVDTGLPLIVHLQMRDLKGLSMNKNVNETIRTAALRLFRTKNEKKSE